MEKETPDCCTDDCRYRDGICEEHGTGETPTEEWGEEIEDLVNNLRRDGSMDSVHFHNFIRSLLSSRDTYWKERVRKEAEGVPITADKGCGNDVWDNKTYETSVHIESFEIARREILQALDNLK